MEGNDVETGGKGYIPFLLRRLTNIVLFAGAFLGGALGAVQKGRTPSLSGLCLVSEGQEGQQAQRSHHPCHHYAVQCCRGLRGQHSAEAQAAQASRQSTGHPALDRHRAGRPKRQTRSRTLGISKNVI